MSSSGAGKRRKTRYTDYERWVGLPHFMLKSLAWAGRFDEQGSEIVAPLSPNAKALFIAVWQRYNGTNNGEIGYGVREAAAIGLHRNTAAKAFDELLDRDFLRVGRDSSFNLKTKETRTWAITALPMTDGTAATKDFMRWSPENKTRSLHRDTQSLHRDRDGESATKLPTSVPPQGLSTLEGLPPQSLHRDTSILPWGEARDGAQPSASAAPSGGAGDAPRLDQHIDDDNRLTPLGDILAKIQRQVEGLARSLTCANTVAEVPEGIPAVLADGEATTVKISGAAS